MYFVTLDIEASVQWILRFHKTYIYFLLITDAFRAFPSSASVKSVLSFMLLSNLWSYTNYNVYTIIYYGYILHQLCIVFLPWTKFLY